MSHPFVTQFCDRHGKTRVRFRRAGFSAYLPPQDAAEFAAEYKRLLAEAPPTPIRSPKSPVGRLRAMLRQRNWNGEGEFIYFIQTRGMVKIGFSSAIVDRISKLAAQSPTLLRPLAIMLGEREAERAVHWALAADKIKGEWFCRSESVKRMIAFAKNGGTYANIG